MTCDRSVQVSQSNQDGDSDEDTGATRPSVTRDEVEYLNHIVVRAIVRPSVRVTNHSCQCLSADLIIGLHPHTVHGRRG